nr:hypothetical protein [Ottowia sp.]
MDTVHAGGIRVIESFLRSKERAGSGRDLSFKDADSPEGRESYRLLDRYRSLARTGRLPEEQLADLKALAFTVDGRSLQEALDPSMAARLAETQLLQGIHERLNRARLQLNQARSDLSDAQRRETLARSHAEAMETYARDFEERVRKDLKDIAELELQARSAAVAGNTYVTTTQLAERIGYDERTIRENMVDRVFIRGVHYVQPFGRKILFLWDVIDRDIKSEAFVANVVDE